MATYKETTTSWQKFLSPLVAAAIAVCSAGAAYLKGIDNTAKSEDRVVERIVKVEVNQEAQSASIARLERESELLKGTLADMKSDLSFIRGKMEGKGNR